MKYFSDGPLNGISFPLGSKPSIKWGHVDGPMLRFSDGQVHWLTWRERFRCWVGWDDAQSLQRKLRPRLTKMIEWGEAAAAKRTAAKTEVAL